MVAPGHKTGRAPAESRPRMPRPASSTKDLCGHQGNFMDLGLSVGSVGLMRRRNAGPFGNPNEIRNRSHADLMHHPAAM